MRNELYSDVRFLTKSRFARNQGALPIFKRFRFTLVPKILSIRTKNRYIFTRNILGVKISLLIAQKKRVRVTKTHALVFSVGRYLQLASPPYLGRWKICTLRCTVSPITIRLAFSLLRSCRLIGRQTLRISKTVTHTYSPTTHVTHYAVKCVAYETTVITTRAAYERFVFTR